MSRLDVTGGWLNYEDDGSGAPVVLLHGGALDLRMWDAQVQPLVDAGYRVVRVDARGHGSSSTPTSPFRHCDDVASLLAGLGLEQAMLVGVSMGAGAAVDTAIAHPERVGAVVAIGAGPSAAYFSDPWMLHVQRCLWQRQLALDADGWVRGFMRQAVTGPYRTTQQVSETVLRRCTEMAKNTIALHATPGSVLPSPLANAWDRLGEISVPLLTVIGSMDAPDHFTLVERLAAGVDGSRSRMVEDAGHLPSMERPDEFNDVLLEFLSSLDTGDGTQAAGTVRDASG